MARGLAQRPLSCVEHPHRPVVDHCDVCRRSFCRECFVRGGAQLLCRECWTAAPVRAVEEARKRCPTYRLKATVRENRASVVAGGIIVAVLALLAVSSAAGVIGESSREQMAEPVARAVSARHLLSGLPTPTPLDPTKPPPPTPIPSLLRNAPSVLLGASGTNLAALVDRRVGEDAPAWRSASGRLPIDVRFATTETVLAGRVLLANSATAPAATWARDVEVWCSPSQDEAETVFAGRWTLAQTTEPQEFAFARTPVQRVRLRILTNFGSTEHTSLAEFALLPAAA